MRAVSTAWIDGEAAIGAPGVSAWLAAICWRKNGFPSAVESSSPRSASVIPAPPSSPSRASASSARSGSSRTIGPRSPSALQSGRASSSSGRARQTSSSGAPSAKSARYSIRSSMVGVAQWMSSTTITSGRRRAPASSARRTARWVSATDVLAPAASAASRSPPASEGSCRAISASGQ